MYYLRILKNEDSMSLFFNLSVNSLSINFGLSESTFVPHWRNVKSQVNSLLSELSVWISVTDYRENNVALHSPSGQRTFARFQ